MGKLDYATLMTGDAKEKLKEISENSVHVCITSPPYWGLRDYNENGQIGLEETPQEYVENLVDVFQEVKRVLHPSGTFWLNIGDSYNGSGGTGTKPNLRPNQEKHGAPPTRYEGLKPKDLCMMPSRVALALQDDGWWLRAENIWAKGISFCEEYSGTCMPESVTDRTTQSHEKLFQFNKSKNYYYDIDAVREDYQSKKRDIDRAHVTGRGDQDYSQAFLGSDQRDKSGGYPFNNEGRNLRSVWTINPSQYRGAHFAVFPLELVEPPIKAGSSAGGVCSSCKEPLKRKDKNEWEKECECETEGVERATVLDPFMGAGTVGIAALKHERKFIGIDINDDYAEMARDRILKHKDVPIQHEWW